jgi:putative thioredoxin
MAQAKSAGPRAVSTAEFGAAVVERSKEIPVLVDFWAAWCGPCRTIAPILDRLAVEYDGRAEIAKVDTDAEPEIATRFGVRSLPTLAVFRHGELAEAVVGAQPEGVLRELLNRHAETSSDGERAEAVAIARNGDVDSAIATLERLVAAEPARHAHLHALVDVLLDSGRTEAASARLSHLPVNIETDPEIVRRRARLDLLQAARDTAPEAAPAASAARSFLDGRTEAALESWLEQLRAPATRSRAQAALRAAFTVLGDREELAAKYRRRMAALLH